MHDLNDRIQMIDQLLPQTQCGLCGHPAGCLPYARAIANGDEPANQCVPGGQPVADALSQLLNTPAKIAEPSVWPVQVDGRPQRVKAVIREDECIGCTKCIHACPVDAIIGSAKMMHVVIDSLCTGCELCLAPCPVDCIDLEPEQDLLLTDRDRQLEQQDLRQRYYFHLIRHQSQSNRLQPKVASSIAEQELTFILQHIAVKDQHQQSNDSAQHFAPDLSSNDQPKKSSTATKKPLDSKLNIQLATLRSQIKRLRKQLSIVENQDKRAQLQLLEQQLLEQQLLEQQLMDKTE